MGQRLDGREIGLFEQGKAVCRVKERERSWVDFCGGFQDVRRQLERGLWGVERRLKK